MLINCDIGERGTAHPIDDQLMQYIDIANIACGGHAGDTSSIDYYQQLAKQNQIKITAHLSYPDRENFGRFKIKIRDDDLIASLYEQYQKLPCAAIKFHGALYHEANNNQLLAPILIDFLIQNKVTSIIAPQNCLLSTLCNQSGIQVLCEGFVERGYEYTHKRLDLIPRGHANAVIENVTDAMLQYQQLIRQGITLGKEWHPIQIDTICIHSDSNIALDLAKAIYASR